MFIDQEMFKKVLPKHIRTNVTQELVDSVNSVISKPEMIDNFRDNLLGFTNVLQDGKFQLGNYIDAVKYVTYKLCGDSNKSAYIKTFPDRYSKLLSQGASEKDISSYVAAYNKNKLVNLIFEQSLIPSQILNAPLYQEALNVQAELMRNARSEKVRSDAANSILNQLKINETKKIQLDIGIKENDAIAELKATTLELVAQQRAMIESRVMNTKEIAHSKLIIEGELDGD